MPIASWSDIADAEDAPEDGAPQLASFADIDAILPAPAATGAPRRATFSDIAAILPPPPAFSPLEQDVIAGSPATQSREAQGFSLAPAQPTVEPPAEPSLMDAIRKSAPARFVEGAAVPVTSIVRGGMALGKTAADQIREGGVAAVPSAVSGIVTGAARNVVEPAVSAIVPPLMQRKPGAAALGTVDQVIPLTDIANRVHAGDYAGAAGEVLSTAAMIAGPHAAERLRGVRPEEGVPPRAEVPNVVAHEAPPEPAAPPADVPAAGAPVPETIVPPADAVTPPNVAHVDDVVAVEPPPVNVAHVSDIVDVVEPGVVATEGVKPAPPVLEPDAQAVRDQTAAPATAHVNDIAEVLEPAAQTSAEIAAAEAERGKLKELDGSHQDASPVGDAPADRGAERGPADESGAPAAGSDADRAERGRLPSAADTRRTDLDAYDGLTFVRQPAEANAARLTPEVRRELERMRDELSNFPFVERPWNDVSGDVGKRGNAAGGDAQIVAGAAGAPVFHDIMGEAPLATPRVAKDGTVKIGRKVYGSRGDASRAIERVLGTSDVHNHIAEGAVRVAERRAAGDYRGLSRPWLPPHWDAQRAPLDPVHLDDLIDADLSTEHLGDVDGDISFDPVALEAESRALQEDTLDTGEKQPRLPGAEDARQAGKADTAFRAPTQASGDDFKLETPLTDDQKAADAREADGPSMFDEPLESARPFRGSWDRPPRLPEKLRDEPRRKPSIDDLLKKKPEPSLDLSDDEPLSMPDRSKRADTSGALVPSPASRALSLLKPGEKQLRPSEIVRDLSKSLDELPIRVGKFKQHALGIYKPREQTIRLKVANDLDTLAHELGHHIHESLLGGELPKKSYRDELEALGLPTSRPSYSLGQKLAEGQAEFTRLYLSDPPAAQKAAPIYHQAFETALESHPELAAVLARAQRQYTGHLSLDPVTRGLSHLDFDGVDPHPKTDIVTRLQTAWVDDLYPMRAMVQDLADHQPIDYTKNGYVLARLARGSSAKAAGFLEHGVRAADGTFIAPALAPALKPVKGQIREFAGYLAALRAIELRGRSMETGMSRAEAQAIVAKFKSPTFDAARDAVYAYQDGLLVYATHAGTLSVDQLTAIKELNKAYVPFQRVIDDVGAAVSQGKGGVANRVSPVKRIKGSGRDIVNPLESIVKNTHTLVSMVEQNRAMQALVDQAQKTTGGGRYLEAIPEKLVPTSFNLSVLEKDIREQLADQGIDLEMSDRDMFDRLVTVFTPTQFRMGEKGVVSVLRDGKRSWFQVNDQALYDAIATIGPKSSDLLVNMLMKPARLLRAGATTSVGFIARNPIRDNVEAYVNSRYGFKPGYDFVRGVFELYHKGEDYQAFLNSGAGNSAMVGLDRNRLRQELVNMGAVKRRAFADSVVLNPINLLQALSEAMEHATRIGEFKRGVETEGRTAEGYARAAMAARDVTIDFARGGAVSKEVNRFTAFFNAMVQGQVRVAEVFRQDPYGATARAVTAITVPSLALWAINHDDPAYYELPDWERNTYWHIATGSGPGHSWARLPKPFTLGMVFGNSVEAALDYMMKKDPEALRRVLPDKQSAWRQAVAVLPTALMPAVEVATNYDTFRDRSIVNAGDVNLDTALQYNRWTSDVAKFVGPKIGIPPAKLDHLIYGYGAGVGAGAAQLVDKAAGLAGLVKNQKPAGGPARMPLVGTFYRETPGADAKSLEDFYRLRDRVDGAVGSVRRYEKADDAAAAAERKKQAQADFAPDADKTLERVRATDKALATVRDQVNQVFANPRLDPDEKKELLDRLYEQMVNGARAGLGRPALPSRFPNPPSPAMLQKLQRPKPSAPAGRPPAVESRPSALPPPRPASPPPAQ